MTKLINTLIFISVFIVHSASAQVEFYHGAGVSTYVGSAAGAGITYSPRLNLVGISDEMKLAVASHPGLGFQGNLNSRGTSSFSFLFDIPLVVELHGWHGSSDASSSKFGGFFGLGFGYTYISGQSSGLFGTTTSASALGLLINGGFKTNILMERSFGVRTGYLIDFRSNHSGVFNLGVFYYFGV